jgi:hypothetical protein
MEDIMEISAHKSVSELYNVLNKDGITNTFDRFASQGKRCFAATGLAG